MTGAATAEEGEAEEGNSSNAEDDSLDDNSEGDTELSHRKALAYAPPGTVQAPALLSAATTNETNSKGLLQERCQMLMNKQIAQGLPTYEPITGSSFQFKVYLLLVDGKCLEATGAVNCKKKLAEQSAAQALLEQLKQLERPLQASTGEYRCVIVLCGGCWESSSGCTGLA